MNECDDSTTQSFNSKTLRDFLLDSTKKDIWSASPKRVKIEIKM